jgi:CRISPR-associated protein Cmr2
MSKCEALIEVNQEEVETLSQYISYCKFYFKPKNEEKIEGYLYKKGEKFTAIDRNKINALEQDFPFLKKKFRKELNDKDLKGKLFKYLQKSKSNETLKDFSLNWLKSEILKITDKVFDFSNDRNLEKIKSISGIYRDSQNLQDYVNKFPRYSFVIWSKFKLQAPYFSRDDDEFYIIQNPILKEKAFKVPMIRGSGWKGALAGVFKDLINESENKKEIIESYLRIFGAGSEYIKNLESLFDDYSKSQESLIDFLLFELGLKLTREDIVAIQNGEVEKLSKLYKEKLKEIILTLTDNRLPPEFQTHKGRAIFYPTYFDRLSLEIINPHDRRKRAGTNPIHYEVVPEGADGTLQIIYIPFDAVLKSEKDLKDEVKTDLENLCRAVEKLQERGIGAKTKLGWGRFNLEEKKYCVNGDIEACEGWERCQG